MFTPIFFNNYVLKTISSFYFRKKNITSHIYFLYHILYMTILPLLFLILLTTYVTCSDVTRQVSLFQRFPGGVSITEPRNNQPLKFGNNKLVYIANDDIHGDELWIVDGPSFSTYLLHDIHPGTLGSDIGFILPVAGTTSCLLFSANDGEHGNELWYSEGNEGDVFMVSDQLAGSQASRPRKMVSNGDYVYYVVDQTASSDAIRRTSCTQALAQTTELVLFMCTGCTNTEISELTSCGTNVYFVATTGTRGRLLWQISGLVAVIMHPILSFIELPKSLLCASNNIYYNGFDPTTGRALMKATSTGPLVVIDTTKNVTQSGPENMGNPGAGSVFFFAGFGTTTGYEPYVSDGSPDGTYMLRDINKGISDSMPGAPNDWVTFGTSGKTVFAATNKDNGRQMYITDAREANASTVQQNLNPFNETVCFIYTNLTTYEKCTVNFVNSVYTGTVSYVHWLFILCVCSINGQRVYGIATMHGADVQQIGRADSHVYQRNQIRVYICNRNRQ